jgi:PBSX family phage terminase large subunit
MKLTIKQNEARKILAGGGMHFLLYGGSRSGKTSIILRSMAVRALKAKSRHAIFRYRFNHIKSSIVMDSFPKVLELMGGNLRKAVKINGEPLYAKFPNGSEIWFGGLDDKLRTEKVLGNEYSTIFFNEISQINYSAVLLAMSRLAENSGLRNVIYYDCNPAGKGHWGYKLFIEGKNPKDGGDVVNPENYKYLLMNPIDNSRNLPQGYIDEILERYPERERNRFLLGLWCDGIEGAIYNKELRECDDDGRICEVLYDDSHLVHTGWDIGISDSTAIWFFQVIGDRINFIDYYVNSGEGLSHYIDKLGEKGYRYGKHFFPHDMRNRSWSTGKSRRETAMEYGIRPVILPNLRIEDGIDACRHFFNRCYFDRVKCGDGIDCLRNYRYEDDESTGMLKQKPLHDWAEHGSSAFRYSILGYDERMYKPKVKVVKEKVDENSITFNMLLTDIQKRNKINARNVLR